MSTIRITMDVYDEGSDPDHETGVTNDTYEALFDALSRYGSDIQIDRVPS